MIINCQSTLCSMHLRHQFMPKNITVVRPMNLREKIDNTKLAGEFTVDDNIKTYTKNPIMPSQLNPKPKQNNLLAAIMAIKLNQ